MVNIKTVQAANAAVATDRSAGRPFVAVFLGGTTGIGSYGLKALAKTHGEAGAAQSRGLRAYVVGRRASDTLMAELRRLCPFGTFAFVQAKDLGLLADVDRVCAAITGAETAAAAADATPHVPKIDLLVESQGVLAFAGRSDTPEGLDFATALAYYGRMRALDRLLPLLTASTPDGVPGRVVSVFNPKLESFGGIVPDDLGLRQPANFTMRHRMAHMGLMMTFYLEAVAQRYPGRLALVHYYPGSVITDIGFNSKLPWYQRAVFGALQPVMYFFSVSEADCGQYVAFLGSSCYPAAPVGDKASVAPPPAGTAIAVGSDGKPGSGAYRITFNGDTMAPNPKLAAYREAGLVDKTYEYTQAAFAAIAAGTKFTE